MKWATKWIQIFAGRPGLWPDATDEETTGFLCMMFILMPAAMGTGPYLLMLAVGFVLRSLVVRNAGKIKRALGVHRA